jgi:hypothetical protein
MKAISWHFYFPLTEKDKWNEEMYKTEKIWFYISYTLVPFRKNSSTIDIGVPPHNNTKNISLVLLVLKTNNS